MVRCQAYRPAPTRERHGSGSGAGGAVAGGAVAGSAGGEADTSLKPADPYALSWALRGAQTLAFGQLHRRPLSLSRTTTLPAGTWCATTVPGPSEESTAAPIAGAVAVNS